MEVNVSLRLHVSPDKFFIEPLESDKNEFLLIDRVSQEISLQENEGQIPATAESKPIFGIFGIIRLLAGPYLIVITDRVQVGTINGEIIWKVTATQVLSYTKTTLHLNEQQVQDNARYLAMVDHMLAADGYYFSTGYDITHTMQRLHNTSPEFQQMPLHERGDVRFIWNGYLLQELAQQQELANYCLPILLGYVSITPCTIQGESFSYAVISRRSCFRAGVRYYIRGINSEGHAANYVETEQIVEHQGSRCSFVQTRGSVPLFWSQHPNLKYKPNPLISTTEDHVAGFQSHFAGEVYNYGKQVIVNLLDQGGQEKQLFSTFTDVTEKSHNPNIRYEPFDFHKECSRMRWDRLSILMDRIADEQDQYEYFVIGRDNVVVSTQKGVFRTNCIDCLDRTNVVQSLLAKRSLQQQLVKLEIIHPNERLENTAFIFTFNNVWADNADACAKQYAGTGALKTDFTRTGKRTSMGLVQDGYNSAVRYFMNNFQDGFRQDSIDLFLGNHIVDETEGTLKPSALRVEKDWKYYALPAIFLVAVSMCIISLLLPDEHLGEQVMYVFFWGGASLLTLVVMYIYGGEFVDRPKLVGKTFKTE